LAFFLSGVSASYWQDQKGISIVFLPSCKKPSHKGFVQRAFGTLRGFYCVAAVAQKRFCATGKKKGGQLVRLPLVAAK